jgi:hypothetical protein
VTASTSASNKRPIRSPGVCDPKTDPRGRIYRFYSYRLRSTFDEPNGYHGFGGA